MNVTYREKAELIPMLDEPNQVPQQMAPAITVALTQHRGAFLRYLARRLKDTSTAEDVFQSFCLRVITSAKALRNSESVVAWLYCVLRSVLTDHYRSEAARQRHDASYAQERIVLGDDHEEIDPDENICSCFHALLPALRPDYAQILRRVDLAGEPRDQIAADLGITPGNVRVRLHRARQALHQALADCCGTCCQQSFRHCTCNHDQEHIGTA